MNSSLNLQEKKCKSPNNIFNIQKEKQMKTKRKKNDEKILLKTNSTKKKLNFIISLVFSLSFLILTSFFIFSMSLWLLLSCRFSAIFLSILEVFHLSSSKILHLYFLSNSRYFCSLLRSFTLFSCFLFITFLLLDYSLEP